MQWMKVLVEGKLFLIIFVIKNLEGIEWYEIQIYFLHIYEDKDQSSTKC